MLPVDDSISSGNSILVFGPSFLFFKSIILSIVCFMMMMVMMTMEMLICDVEILMEIILGKRDRLFYAGLGNLWLVRLS